MAKSVDLDEVAHYEQKPHQVFANSAIFVSFIYRVNKTSINLTKIIFTMRLM